MKKKLILLVALLPGIPVMAMEHIKERPVLKEASQHEEATVKIHLTDSQNLETPHEVEIPVRLAKLIGALNKDLVEEPALKDSVFPVPNVSIAIWRLIEPQLERVYGIAHDASQAAHLREAIMTEFRTLDVKSLIEVICASDYLEIPLLLGSACEVVKQSAPDKISWEELEVLPLHIRNQIIMNKVVMLLGPVPARELALCRGHEGAVTAVCVSPDDKIVSGSYDGTVRIWDMEGNTLGICRGHEGLVMSVCMTKDGKIVSGSEDRTVRVCDMKGNQLAVCRGHEGMVSSVSVTKDGKIVSGSYDKTVRIWDMEGTQLAVCRGHQDFVPSVCVTQDGKIVSGSWDRTVRVWDIEGNQLAECRGHENMVLSVCVTRDGKIVSGSVDNTVRVWDMEGNQIALCRGHKYQITSVCVTKEGNVVSGSRDETVRVWHIEGNQLAVCRGHNDCVMSVYVTQDGKIVSGSNDDTVRVWDISLLDSIVRMGEDQTQALCEFLQSISKQTETDKHKWWSEIEKILGEDAPVAPVNINNNNNE